MNDLKRCRQLENVARCLDKVTQNNNEMMKCITKLQAKIEEEIKKIVNENYLSRKYYSEEDIMSDIDRIYKELNGTYHNIYKCYDILPGIFEKNNDGKDDKKEIGNGWQNVIKVKIINEEIYVKTPLLMSKRKITYGKFTSENSLIFKNEIIYEIEKKFDEILKIRENLGEKNISIIAIYSVKKSNNRIPDTNNLDTKKVIDAITMYLPGGDSAMSCSFNIDSIKTDKVDEGVYFIVQKGKGIFNSTDENLRKIINFMETK